MAKRYRQKKNKKRGLRRKYRRGTKSVTKVRSLSFGFPDVFKTRLKYNEVVHLSSILPSYLAYATYRANSVYDPNYAIGGASPRFFNQFKAVYDKYVVLGCKVKVMFSNQSTTVPANVLIWFGDELLLLPTFNDYAESRYKKLNTIGSSQGEGNTTLSMFMPMKKLLGQNSLNSDPYVYSYVNTNPTDEVFFALVASATDSSSAVNVYATMEVTYYVLFKGVKNVPQSTS